MNKIVLSILFLSIIGVLFSSCEEEFVPNDVVAKNEYVVEGSIELSDLQIPTYVILTKSTSYFSTLDSIVISDMYVDDAEVSVNDGEKIVNLEYVCANNLPIPLLQKLAPELRGKLFSSDLCLYLDIKNQIIKEVGRTYELVILHEGHTVTSKTSLVKRISLDSIRFEETPGEKIDSLAMLWGIIDDPGEIKNFYKYTVRENFKRVYDFNSVFDDMIINGQRVDLPYQKPANPRDSDFDHDIGFLYNRGDTIQFKLCSIDEDLFNFWESFQFSSSQGPFSSYIRANDNIDGGIGAWGASNCQVVNMIVPEK